MKYINFSLYIQITQLDIRYYIQFCLLNTPRCHWLNIFIFVFFAVQKNYKIGNKQQTQCKKIYV